LKRYKQLKEGIKLCRQMSDRRAQKIGYFLLAKVQLAKGDYEESRKSIRMGEKAVEKHEVAHDLRGADFPQVRLWLEKGNIPALKAWLEENNPSLKDVVHFKTILTYTMHARVLIALGREYPEEPYLKDAQDLLKELFKMADNNGWGSKVIEILCLQALAYSMREEDTDRAIDILERAINQAEPEGFIRTFVDEGPPMAQLLYEALHRGVAPDYVRRLLAAFPVTEPEKAA
jgi:LuxR family maltose regulon positive regulatory protein